MALRRIVLLIVGFSGWALVYFMQDFDLTRMEFRFNQYVQGHIPEGESWRFMINKSWRFLLNDLFSLLVIYGLFHDKNKLKVAVFVLLFGLFILLPLYLFLAVTAREQGHSLLVFMHRLTM